jgi:transcriptional regulator with XRE-family HTH domain
MRTSYKAPKDIADRLKGYRLDRCLTLQAIADMAGITVNSIWRIENGLTVPTELTWAKLRVGLPGLDEAA